MIDWIYQTTVIITAILFMILLFRQEVSKHLGANITYWLWLFPLFPISGIIANTHQSVPVAIIEKTTLSNGKLLIQVIDNPTIHGVISLYKIEVIWLIGFLAWVLFRFVSWYSFYKNINQNRNELSIQELIPESKELTKDIKVKFYTTTSSCAPFATGIFNQCIYLPSDFFQSYSKPQQLSILKHELIHIKRGDISYQLLAEAFRAVYWFNPIIHYAYLQFIKDQELACDYAVLSKSTEQERHDYGKALLKRLNTGVQPFTNSFFTYQKLRFNMLEKHTYSQTKNNIGVVICTLIGVYILTNASLSFAIENKSDNKVSFKMNDIELKSVIQLVTNANQRTITGYENVPNIKISVDATDVSAKYFEVLLLKCSSLKLVTIGDKFKIEKRKKYEGTSESMNKCLQEIQDKKFTQLVK